MNPAPGPLKVPPELDNLVRSALREDIGRGDLTTRVLFREALPAEGRVIARQDLVISGIDVLKGVFSHLDPSLSVRSFRREGERVSAGDILATIQGDGRRILTGERVALNFIQHLSGVATLTASYVEALKEFKARLLDTRKTLPGLRVLEKRAVRAGGGLNHRMGLDDAILIKDNHIALHGSIGKAIRTARENAPPLSRVLVEARSIEQVDEAVSEGAHWILLDNMTTDQLRTAVERIKGRAETEASGGASLENLRAIASTGVDYISAGRITHSAPAADISLDLIPLSKGGKSSP
ncbi:MAG TPA: carboxylating nicotinate-nucleotide diphosphorylase [Nitrospiria bacterium]